MREDQYQQVLQPNITQREFITRKDHSQQQPEKKRFEGQCFLYGTTGCRKLESRSRQRDEISYTLKAAAMKLKPLPEEKPKSQL